VLLGTYWLALFIMTHLPGDPVGYRVTMKDKAGHGLAFALLAVLLAWVVLLAKRRFGPIEAMAVGVTLSLYAAFDELTQPIVGRRCDIYDWLSDVGGIVVGIGFVWALALLWRWQRTLAAT
jgi:VanZ family protein